ncbi:hypothetical protein FA592_08660 [Sulfurospirillum diekertiae]|uniref:Uncharacterized protein n=1 Tax=Sulfurospirillum diekertiae TaxID=1854492 RepID=A0A6G9VTJ3_9BACT|nr:hypothetical protein [Sulfurospirillum diekertiae]QIR76301.1 hypothetical protein FA584_08800 [Sulfurospirillum diekertiae]QIR78932.1 hypothetical protein FA592_08660 [Sulfurospirillum diekertiae]
MKLQRLFLMGIGVLISASSLFAADFDWMVSLNMRSHEDPYGYRYSLVDRFGVREPDVMVILSSVYDPADAYMIFRLAELSGRPPEYILRVYRERRHRGWGDIAYFLGIRPDAVEYIELRERYDTRYIYHPRGHYEDRRDMPVRRVYVEPRHYDRQPEPQHYEHQPEHRDYDRNERKDHNSQHRDKGDDDRRDDGRDRR